MNRKHYDFDLKQTVSVPAEEQYVYEHKVPCNCLRGTVGTG